jgi:large subunit ribosomal protein L22
MVTAEKKKDVQAVARYVRISPLKARRILQLIRGKSVGEAKNILQLLPHKAAKIAEKVLASAVSNAGTNHKLNKDSLYVSAALADQAFILKRFRAVSRGRGVSIHKKLSHITVRVNEIKEKK